MRNRVDRSTDSFVVVVDEAVLDRMTVFVRVDHDVRGAPVGALGVPDASEIHGP